MYSISIELIINLRPNTKHHARLGRPICLSIVHGLRHPYDATVSQVYPWTNTNYSNSINKESGLNCPHLNAERAAATAISTSCLPASWISAITLPVAGFVVGKFLPDLLLYHSLLMNNWNITNRRQTKFNMEFEWVIGDIKINEWIQCVRQRDNIRYTYCIWNLERDRGKIPTLHNHNAHFILIQ